MAVSDYGPGTNWNNEAAYLNGLIAQGGGNATWALNQLADLNAAKNEYGGSNQVFPSALGDYQNMLDQITGISEKNTGKSLELAQQYQEWSAMQAQIANEFNAAEAAKNRDWQEYMANTAHQREIKDLKAAGLNPVLSAMNGNGANVGSGATASANMPQGTSGKVDTSANSALVSILGSMLSAQTNLANAALSARTQEAVAEKYTAMSYLTSQIAAGASMYGSDMMWTLKHDFPDNEWQIINQIMKDYGVSYRDGIDAIFNGLTSKPTQKGLEWLAGKVAGWLNPAPAYKNDPYQVGTYQGSGASRGGKKRNETK